MTFEARSLSRNLTGGSAVLNTRLRKQIEWHFYNHKADLELDKEKERDILDGGLTVNFECIGSRASGGSQTESKAVRLESLECGRNWATVVRNTFNAFRFEPEYEIMDALYIKKKSYKELCVSGIWESTIYRWRDKWLEYAYKWAKEFNLI